MEGFISGDPEDLVLADEFPISSRLEDYGFTLFHKVVIGIAHLPLIEALLLSQCPNDFNCHTATGFTPLRIAAIRGEAETCCLVV